MLPDQNYGTGNINDTNTGLIRQQAFDLLNFVRRDPIAAALTNTSQKYSILYTTSRSLFNMILKEATTTAFNEIEFKLKLDSMLLFIEKIQKSQVSQYDASGEIGKMLAYEYIDVIKDVPKDDNSV
jgi:hypothetical protein